MTEIKDLALAHVRGGGDTFGCVRDVTLGEDHCRVRTGAAPYILSTIRNSLLNLLRRFNKINIAASLRRHAAHPQEALKLLRG